MGIFSRTRDIIAANVTDLLDKAEDPAKVLSQTIEDMSEELKKARQEVVSSLASVGVRHLTLSTEGDWLRPLTAFLRRGRRTR